MCIRDRIKTIGYIPINKIILSSIKSPPF